jgi:hypothetical protein
MGSALGRWLAALVCLGISEEGGGYRVESERGAARWVLGVMAKLSYVVGRTL